MGNRWLLQEMSQLSATGENWFYQFSRAVVDSTITSGGKRKPAKADRETGAGQGRRVLMRQFRRSDTATANATAPFDIPQPTTTSPICPPR
jgi:hypothetical protein